MPYYKYRHASLGSPAHSGQVGAGADTGGESYFLASLQGGSNTSAAQQSGSLLPLCCLLSDSQREQVSLENFVKCCLTASLSKMNPVQQYPVCTERK